MAGNMAGDQKLDILWASMSLHWGNPVGDAFEPWLKRAKAAGYDGVTCFSSPGLHSFFGKEALLTRNLKNTGMQLAAVDIQLDAPPDEFDRVMDVMNAVDCKLLVAIVHGAHDKTPDLYKRYAERINQAGLHASERGIRAHLHNNSDSIGRNAADWRALMPLIDWNHVYLMADTGHMTKDFDEGLPAERAYKFLSDNWDKLHYLEFKDYSETADLNAPLGEGLCDYAHIFALMRERGYSGWITIEQNGLPPGRGAEECARASRAFVRGGLGV